VASHWPQHIVMEELCFDTTYELRTITSSCNRQTFPKNGPALCLSLTT
jgi:hypothetical protein